MRIKFGIEELGSDWADEQTWREYVKDFEVDYKKCTCCEYYLHCPIFDFCNSDDDNDEFEYEIEHIHNRRLKEYQEEWEEYTRDWN